MRRVQKIELIGDTKIVCFFKNGEQRLLDLSATLKDKYGKLVTSDKSTYLKAKIGHFGEISWEGLAEMKDYDGNSINCSYDMSAEFAYQNSTLIKSH